jgi:hypothetical protein
MVETSTRSFGSGRVLDTCADDAGKRGAPDYHVTEGSVVTFIIGENPVYQQLQTARIWIIALYDNRVKGVALIGPPGVGKTLLAYTLAEARGIPICALQPGTARGLMQCFFEYQDVPIILLDDIDWIWTDLPALMHLKHALDNKPRRILSYIVGSGEDDRRSIPPFELKARVLFLTNKNLYDRTQFTDKIWVAGIEPLLDRCVAIALPYDPAAHYDHTGWLGSTDGMLRKLYFDWPLGEPMLAKNGSTVIATPGNRRRFLSRLEQDEILGHFYQHAPRYPSISPRKLAEFASFRIGKPLDQWECEIAPLLTGSWDLPKDRIRFSTMPADLPRDLQITSHGGVGSPSVGVEDPTPHPDKKKEPTY